MPASVPLSKPAYTITQFAF